MTYVISYSNTTATLDRIVRGQRRRVNPNTVEYSQNGTPIIDGPTYGRLIHVWDIEAYCSPEATDALLALEEEQRRLLEIGQEPKFRLTDYRKKVVEAAPRKRALAPGRAVSNLADSKVSYLAQFYCLITALEIGEQSAQNRNRVVLTLAEGEILPP